VLKLQQQQLLQQQQQQHQQLLLPDNQQQQQQSGTPAHHLPASSPPLSREKGRVAGPAEPPQQHKATAAAQTAGYGSSTSGTEAAAGPREAGPAGAAAAGSCSCLANPYALLRDPAAAVRGKYTIPQEVLLRSEEQRWLRHSGDTSSDDELVTAGQQRNANDTVNDTVNDNLQSLQDKAELAGLGKAVRTGQQAAGGPGPAGSDPSGSAAVKDKGSSSLAPSVREKLLAAAPKLQVSGEVRERQCQERRPAMLGARNQRYSAEFLPLWT